MESFYFDTLVLCKQINSFIRLDALNVYEPTNQDKF